MLELLASSTWRKWHGLAVSICQVFCCLLKRLQKDTHLTTLWRTVSSKDFGVPGRQGPRPFSLQVTLEMYFPLANRTWHKHGVWPGKRPPPHTHTLLKSLKWNCLKMASRPSSSFHPTALRFGSSWSRSSALSLCALPA